MGSGDRNNCIREGVGCGGCGVGGITIISVGNGGGGINGVGTGGAVNGGVTGTTVGVNEGPTIGGDSGGVIEGDGVTAPLAPNPSQEVIGELTNKPVVPVLTNFTLFAPPP